MTAFPLSGHATPQGAPAAVLLHDALAGDDERRSHLFEDPRAVITARRGGDISGAMAEVEAALDDGLHVAGAIAYELGAHLEPRLGGLARDDGVLFQFGAFASHRLLNAQEATGILAARAQTAGEPVTRFSGGEDAEGYRARIARLHDYILSGDIYQANFTFPLRFPWRGDPWSLYGRLTPNQRVGYGAVVDLPDCRLACLSPELFFRKEGDRIESRPMKGTIRRGRTPAEDAELAETLRRDPKSRAENLMILDLIRNDIGRLAVIGSVAVPRAFEIETFQTLHQMTSTVTGRIDPDLSLLTVLRHLFPCGSVTGAPKIRAMEIIAELETGPRGFYTGALGYVTPQREMCFNVPIRTIELEGEGMARMGVGSGIVYDSVAEDEYAECLLKARFLEMGMA